MPSAYVGSILTVNPGTWVDEVVNINVTATNVVSTVIPGKNYAWLVTLSSAPTAPFNGWQTGDIYVSLDSTWYVNNGGANWIGPAAPPHYSITNVSGNVITVVGDYQLNDRGWGLNLSTTPTLGAAIITRPRLQRKFQWYRGTTPIPGATAATYTLSTADAGQQVSFKETAFAWNTPDSITTISSAPYDVIATPGADKLVFQDNIAYVGSFRVGGNIQYPNPAPTYENRALSINPAGYNGNTTMFLNGAATSKWLGEFQIPVPKNTGDFNSMNDAPLVRTPLMVDPTEGQLYASGMNGGTANSIWGSLMIPGTSKMLVSAVNWYTYNPTALFWRRPLNLGTTGQVEQPFMVLDTTAAGTGTNPRWTSGFMCYIPSTPVNGVNYQTALGGNVLSGVCGISIASTQSAGPAAISWNYNDIDATLAKASSGSVQAATISTITLASTASATNDFYNGQYLYVSSGPGAGASVKITAYNGSTKVATVSPHIDPSPWISAVNITSVTNSNPVKIRVLRAYIGDRTGVTISGVGGATELNGNTYYLKYTGGGSNFSDCDLYSDINLTSAVNGTSYGSYTTGGTINGTPTSASSYITYPILQGRQLVGYKDGTDLQRFQEGVITPIWSWNSGARGMCIPDGTRSLLFFGNGSDGKGIYSPRYYIASQSNYGPIGYDPVGQGTGPHAYPYSIRIWAYDLDELAKVYRNEKTYNDLKPYGVFTLQLPGAGSSEITSANYDPETRRVYIATGQGPGGGAVVHAYQITNAVASSIIAAPTVVDVTNSMTVNLSSGSATNYPYQFGRVFNQGSIIDYPQVLLDGSAITTQADVKNRWPDGSVKFAIISVILPFVGTTTKTITFQNQTTNNSTPETVANMLANYDFNAAINATVSATPITGAPISARTMLSALSDSTLLTNTVSNSPNSRYWTQGPVCTTVILADHLTKSYDFGTDSNKSLRPVFQVQFWPSIGVYRVRTIVEQSDTTKLQSQTYDVSLSTGNTSPSTVYTRASVPHNYGSRWTKQFWAGVGAPSQELNVQHNVGYLASTKAIPNYDSSITLSETTKISTITSWNSASKDLYNTGLWNKYMPATGGRPDIGIFPDWHIAALYSGDSQLWNVVKGQADLAGAWPMCFRSGDTRVFDSTNLAAGKGKIATRDSHPTQFLNGGNSYMNQTQHGVVTADLWNVVGTISDGGWICDDAHQPDPYYLLYITGGDHWHLEQLQFWSSWSLFGSNPGNAAWAAGRDPRDAPIQGQVRGVAWALRNRARSAYASVDSSPEKIYLTRATEQALRQFEGRQISTVGNDPSGIRQFWATTYPLGTPNSLRYWNDGGNDPGNLSGLNSTVVGTGESPWMFSMLVSALAHTTELGFNAQEIFSWAAQAWITMINSGDVDPRHLADYRYPVKNKAGSFYQNWHDALNSANYNPAWTSVWETDKTNLNHGYSNFASLAVAMSANEPGGASAWSWMNANGYSTNDWSQNPKMAIIPRLEASAIITSPSYVDTTNSMTLSLPAGTSTNYPYQFGRVFKQGAIADYPQVLINGEAQTTQADVKNRWPDGSVKFAVISIIVSSLNTTTKTLTFQNQVAGSNTPETKANMLANYDFNCTINATSAGSPITGAPISARTILNAISDATLASNTVSDSPNSRYWTQGPICTTIILCDHTTKVYDFGTTADKSLRPIFHVQFWPSLNKYKVRVIVEQSDVTKIQTQTYDVSVSTGNASPTIVYTKSSVQHNYGGRWTKAFWSGISPALVNIDHNSNYLSSARVIPNYDPAVKLPEGKIVTLASSWNSSSTKGIFENGNKSAGIGWEKTMGNVGGRPEISLFPNWTIDSLLSGDHRLQNISDSLSELALAWPMNQREGASGKYYDAAQTIPGIGFPVSLFARPTMFYYDNQYMDQNWAIANPADRFTWISGTDSGSNNGWSPGGAHQSSPFFIPYLTTGEYVWLEQMQFWAAWGAFNPQPNTTSGYYGRGPTLTSGGLNGSCRRRAWHLRSRAQAAAFSVDNSKEKSYYTTLLNDAIAIEEGIHGITGSAFQGNTAYQWGVTVGRPDPEMYGPLGVSPIYAFESGTASYAQSYYDAWVPGINRGFGGWQQNYMIIALSHTKDLGFPVDELRNWAASYIIDAAANDQTAPLLGQFVIPVTYGTKDPDVATGYIPTWAAVFAAYIDPTAPKTIADSFIASVDSQNSSAVAAAATIHDLPGGLAAYNWMKTNWVDKRPGPEAPAYYPWVSRWSIIPRQ